MVQLHAPPRRCRDIAAAVVAAHGPPLLVSDLVILRLDIWHDEATATRIRLMTSAAGICDLHYERLEPYRQHDLDEAAA